MEKWQRNGVGLASISYFSVNVAMLGGMFESSRFETRYETSDLTVFILSFEP